MIEKNELITRLQNAAKTEESLVSIYSNHMQSVLAHSGLEMDVRREISAILQKLTGDSYGHDDFMLDLIDSLSKSDKDVY
jgi:thiamine phosphate synthase YjbQ (UPF0047 family)